MENNLREDDLQIGGLTLLQDKTAFCFGVDAVLLSDFASVKPGSCVLDLGCGNGVIPLLLSAKSKASKIVGLEIQEAAAELARQNTMRNRLEHKIEIVWGDLTQISKLFPKNTFDAVVSNPPYKKRGSGIVNPNDAKYIARHETACTLDDVVQAAAYVLKPMGKFYLIHRPDRLAEIFRALNQTQLEPKKLRLVCPRAGKAPTMVLIEAAKGERPYLTILPNLYIQNEDLTYTDEINRIYGREGTPHGK